MKSWNELSHKEQLVAMHYDLYKDVHGVRPRWINYDDLTEEALEAELDRLVVESDMKAAVEQANEEAAIVLVEHRIQEYMGMGAKDRATAVRWLHEAENSDGDAEYLCFLLGVPYGYFERRI